MNTETDYNFPGRIKVQDRLNKPTSLFQKLMHNGVNSEYEKEKNHYATKLAEIDYMLGVIEKHNVKKSISVYETINLCGLKKELIKRLGDFAESETHRDFNCVYGE